MIQSLVCFAFIVWLYWESDSDKSVRKYNKKHGCPCRGARDCDCE